MVEPAPLAGDAIHVWRVALHARPAGVAQLPDERRRADRMRDEVGRARFLASRAWLRVVLSGYLGADAASVRLVSGARGKPSIVGGGELTFSLSRSADVALIAVTRARAVGVDVEQVRHDVEHASLAGRFFSPAEAAHLRDLPEPERTEAFFALWVLKEAVVKASGAGLGDGISHLDVRRALVAGRWSVASLDAGPGFAAAVAVDGAMGSCSLWAVPSSGPGGPSPTKVRGGAPAGRSRR